MNQQDIKAEFRTILMGAASLLCAEAERLGLQVTVDAHVSDTNLVLIARYESEEIDYDPSVRQGTYWFSLNSNNEIAMDEESREAYKQFYAEETTQTSDPEDTDG